MKSLFSVVLGLSLCLLVTPANADVIFSIDMDTSVAGIQSSRVATSGDTFQAALVMQLTNGTRVAAFSLGVDFDKTELSASSVDFSGRPGGFGQVNTQTSLNTSFFINNDFTPTSGRVRPFDALNLGGAIETNTTTILGLITFTVLNPTADLNDITPSQQTSGIDDVLDGDTFLPIPLANISFISGSITAVPEPTTWLFGAVLVGFGAKRLRKRFSCKTCRE